MSVKRIIDHLLTPAGVRRSASAGVDATVVPRPGTFSEASASVEQRHQLSRRETGYASYGDPGRDSLVDDGQCSPHAEVAVKTPSVEVCHEQEVSEQGYGYVGEVAVESMASADGRYPYHASLGRPSRAPFQVKEPGTTISGDDEIRNKFRHVTIRPRRRSEPCSSPERESLSDETGQSDRPHGQVRDRPYSQVGHFGAAWHKSDRPQTLAGLWYLLCTAIKVFLQSVVLAMLRITLSKWLFPTSVSGYPNFVNVPDFQANQKPRAKPKKPFRKNRTCFNCGERELFWRNCPMHTVHANGATVGRLGNETYLQISVNGCEVSCLLDTGCEKSMLPRRLIPNTPLQPVDISVDAANGIKIPILGSVDCNSRSISSRFST